MPPRKRKRVKKKMSKHMCIYVASNCTHVVLLPGKFMNFFFFWSHDMSERGGLEHNNAALL